jgi:hypothetical protein
VEAGGEGEEGTANSRRRVRKEVEEQARGKGGATGAAVWSTPATNCSAANRKEVPHEREEGDSGITEDVRK